MKMSKISIPGLNRISLKTWAIFMALNNLAIGIIIISSVWLVDYEVLEFFSAPFAFGVIVGILNIFAAGVLIGALINGNEKYVLLYFLLDFIGLFTLTIVSALFSFDPDASKAFIGLFVLCLFYWIVLYQIYKFYLELNEYNHSSIQAGINEIACNTQLNSSESFPERAVDTTMV